QPYKTYSIRNLSRLIKTSYALTYGSVQSLIKKKLINMEKIGNSSICRLNLSADPREIAIASLIHSKKYLDKADFGYLIKEIQDKLIGRFYIMLLFGSHAKGKAGKDSDIDLLFAVEHSEDIEKTRKNIMSVISSTKKKIDFDVITTEWLLKMFDEKDSVGREALLASIVLRGAESYYGLVNTYDKKRGY
ncbi:hypothetical protein COT47_03475, partial [Candidatus Woesearchaeota archaeon CG08_land_8_20_14_0_20_43_7]